jgi:oxaloacetate decarboxylase alpha subunit
MVRALQGTEHDVGLDLHHLFEIANYWEDLRRRRGFERGVTRINDMMVFDHQVPGGMITNLVSQLEEQKALHRMQDVLKEIPRVRAELGYPPLVTPTSQIVGIQGVLNVLQGERYKIVPQQVKDYVRGFYGKPPAPIDKKIQRLIIGDEEPITCRPADLIENRFERMREEIRDLAESEEDYITYALFPAVARKFFEYRKKVREDDTGCSPAVAEAEEKATPRPAEPAKRPAEPASGRPPGAAWPPRTPASQASREDEEMNIEDVKEFIRLVSQSEVNELQVETAGMKVKIRKGAAGEDSACKSASRSNLGVAVGEAEQAGPPAAVEPRTMLGESRANLIEVVAPMVGTFYRAPAPDAPPFVEAGSRVKEGQTLCIIEAMKLMNEIEAESAGEIVEILVENAQPIEYGQVLFLIEPEG